MVQSRSARFSRLPAVGHHHEGVLAPIMNAVDAGVITVQKAASMAKLADKPLPAAVIDPAIEEYLEVVEKGLHWSCQTPLKIAIVGGGLAGLCAAQVLTTGPFDVTIFEATHRIGGRVNTVRAPFYKNHAEAGAMRIPEAHKIVNAYIKKFNLSTEIFNGSDDNGFYYLYGQSFNIGEYQRDPTKLHQFIHSKGFELNPELLPSKEKPIPKRIDEFWEDTLQKLLREVNYPIDSCVHNKAKENDILAAWGRLCQRYDVSFRDYLANYATPRWLEGTMELFGLIGSGIGGYQSTFSSSFLENVREEISLRSTVTNPDVIFREIIGGNDRLAESFVSTANLDQRILLGSRVSSVTKKDNETHYTITYKKDKDDLTIGGFDHVIMTIPFTQMPSIIFEPVLSTGKMRCIRELHYQHASKVMLQFSSRFWLDKNGPLRFSHGGALSTDLPIKNIYFPDHGEGRGVIIASYTWESDALYWASKSAEEQKRDALEQFARIIERGSPNPINIRPLYEGGDVKNWTTDPHTAGAYAFFEPTQMSQLFADVASREGSDGKIHFAGEHASFDHAWIEGALQSGIRVALEINDIYKPQQ